MWNAGYNFGEHQNGYGYNNEFNSYQQGNQYSNFYEQQQPYLYPDYYQPSSPQEPYFTSSEQYYPPQDQSTDAMMRRLEAMMQQGLEAQIKQNEILAREVEESKNRQAEFARLLAHNEMMDNRFDSHVASESDQVEVLSNDIEVKVVGEDMTHEEEAEDVENQEKSGVPPEDTPNVDSTCLDSFEDGTNSYDEVDQLMYALIMGEGLTKEQRERALEIVRTADTHVLETEPIESEPPYNEELHYGFVEDLVEDEEDVEGEGLSNEEAKNSENQTETRSSNISIDRVNSPGVKNAYTRPSNQTLDRVNSEEIENFENTTFTRSSIQKSDRVIFPALKNTETRSSKCSTDRVKIPEVENFENAIKTRSSMTLLDRVNSPVTIEHFTRSSNPPPDRVRAPEGNFEESSSSGVILKGAETPNAVKLPYPHRMLLVVDQASIELSNKRKLELPSAKTYSETPLLKRHNNTSEHLLGEESVWGSLKNFELTGEGDYGGFRDQFYIDPGGSTGGFWHRNEYHGPWFND